MEKTERATRTALLIILLSLISTVLGFAREALIGAKFGLGSETDAYFIAMSVAGLLSIFIVNSISTTFIPVISEIEAKEGKEGKNKHTSNIINIIFLVSILASILAFLATPLIVKFIAIGFEGDKYNLTVELSRIGLPIILFSGVTAVFTGYLQSENRFKTTALIGVPFNIIYIIFLLTMTSYYGIEGLMITSVIAVFSQLLIQIPEVIGSGFKYRFEFNLKDKYIIKVLKLSLPVFVSVAINDFNIIIDRVLASFLVEGSISALNYANKLNSLILSVFVSAITVVVFPLLSKEANKGNTEGLKKTMAYGINLILLLTVPASIGLIVLATPIVEIVFQRGVFDAIATSMTVTALIYYSIGLVAMSLRLYIVKVYFSIQDTKTPMINSGILVILSVVLNLILVKYLAHGGLALATSLATTFSTIILLYGLKKKMGSLGMLNFMIIFIKITVASLIMGAVAYIVYHSLYKILGVSSIYKLLSLLIAVVIGIIVYGVMCYMFKIEEIRMLLKKQRKNQVN